MTDNPHTGHNSRPETSLNRLQDGALRFRSYSLGVYCFETWGCTAHIGNDSVWSIPADEWTPPQAEFRPGLRERMRGSRGPFKITDGPLVITWRDRDKHARSVRIDLPTLLAPGLIPYRTPAEKIRPDVTVGPPDLIVQVEDDHVHLSLRTRVPLREPVDAANPLSDVVTEWTAIYEGVGQVSAR